MGIPTGYGFVAGRSSTTAKRLIAAAKAIDSDPTDIRTVTDGYHAANDVVEAYNDEDLAVPADKKKNDPFSLNAPNTNGEPFVESTTIESERTLETGSTPITEAAANRADETSQVGVGTETSEADNGTKSAEEPAGNASGANWLAFAKAQPSWDDADAELGRDDLRAKYGTPTPDVNN